MAEWFHWNFYHTLSVTSEEAPATKYLGYSMIFGSHSTFEAAGLADNHEALRPSLQNYKINKAGLWVTPSFDFLPCCFLRLHYMPFPGQYKDFRKPSVTRSLERQCRMVSQSILALFFWVHATDPVWSWSWSYWSSNPPILATWTVKKEKKKWMKNCPKTQILSLVDGFFPKNPPWPPWLCDVWVVW